MSLGIAIKGPEGLVLAAESRVTVGTKLGEYQVPVYFDNATKVFGLEEPNNFTGLVTYGQALIGQRTAYSFLPELDASLKAEGGARLPVKEISQRISDFYMSQWKSAHTKPYVGPPMTFLVGGFDEGAPYGRIFEINLPTQPAPKEQSPGENQFGITWGGQREFVDRLIQGYDPQLFAILKKQAELQDEDVEALKKACAELQMKLPMNVMALQDCVDLALFFIKTTILGQELVVGIRGCGGQIDIATITRREGLRYVQRKQIRGERRHT
jgi:hypothetical protein